jgi:hypothetical protein
MLDPYNEHHPETGYAPPAVDYPGQIRSESPLGDSSFAADKIDSG